MTRAQAIVAASAAAEGVYRALGGRIGWYFRLHHSIDALAHFVESWPGARGDDLCRFASGGQTVDQLWNTDAPLAAAVECFDATLRNLLSRGQRDAAFPTSPRGGDD